MSQNTYIFELTWDLKIRRRETRTLVKAPVSNSDDIDSETREKLVSYLRKILNIELSKGV